MAYPTCLPDEAVAPFYLLHEDVPVASPDGYCGLRFDVSPPSPFPLTSAANEGTPATREQFLAACEKYQPARA